MIHKKLLSLLVLLMTVASGAWADNTVYTSGQSVRIVDLKVGDIILPGATVTRDGMSTPSIQRLKFRRCTTEWVEMTESLPVTFDENAGLGDYHVGGKPLQPIDENGNVGNAWQVAVLTLEPFGYIATLDGITYRDPNAPVISEDGTEATFNMPAYDATASYDIVRDLATSTKVDLIIGTGSDAVTATADTRLRIQKDNTYGYLPVSALSCNFVDQIEGNTILPTGFDDAKLTPLFYLQGEDDTWNLVTDINTDTKLPNNLQPGQVYRITLKAADGSYYDGETQPSYTVTLFEGYEVKVPAGEYVTFYKDEPLYADPVSSADAVLYTISSVSTTDGTATLSGAIATAPSNTPLLVYNSNTSQDKTFLLIPADAEPNLALTVAREFTGTLTGTTIAASTSTKNNYALNGKQFVWVKNQLDIAANKAYLSVTTGGQLHAPALNIVFDDNNMTAIDSMVNGQSSMGNGDWYDLNGRKLSAAPKRKGVYIKNGQKVVVK